MMSFIFRENVDQMSRKALVDYVGDLEMRLQEITGSVDNDVLVRVKVHFDVRPSGAAILVKLSDGRPCSREHLHALSGKNMRVEPHIINVQMCHLRKKLVGTGIVIENLWGTGYRMVSGMEAVRTVMRGDA